MKINADKIHLYHCKNVLKPRGSMEKESVGKYIEERLLGVFESWTDETYKDNPTRKELLNFMKYNLLQEVDSAWNFFKEKIKE